MSRATSSNCSAVAYVSRRRPFGTCSEATINPPMQLHKEATPVFVQQTQISNAYRKLSLYPSFLAVSIVYIRRRAVRPFVRVCSMLHEGRFLCSTQMYRCSCVCARKKRTNPPSLLPTVHTGLIVIAILRFIFV